MHPRLTWIIGRERAPAELMLLRAGPVTASFDPETGFLRHIRYGNKELLRGIYGAVRDRNWGTIAPRISKLEVHTPAAAFFLTFEAECQRGEIDFQWKGMITGNERGQIIYRFDGIARSSFLRNRIGLCALHPIAECAGQPCIVEHPDHTAEQGAFPLFIAPHQPFKNIRCITYQAASSLHAEVCFDGEVFEMEDQRNWTDASFKTYGPPLDLPFPAMINAGTRVQQTVTLSLFGNAPEVPHPSAHQLPRLFEDTSSAQELLPVGLGMASHGESLSAREVERLRVLRLAHLRVDLTLSDAGYRARLRQAAQEATALGAKLHVALFLTDEADRELADLLETLRALRPPVALWLVFHVFERSTSEHWVQLATQRLAEYDPQTPLAAGTNAHFTELNRQRPAPTSKAYPCYSINPQVHAFDNLTMVENLAAQMDTVLSTRRFSPHPVVISPITLRPRFNPNATAAAETAPDELPSQVDVRQMSLFGAAWTLGSLAQLATARQVHSLTYFETTGWRGIMEREAGSPLPAQFPSLPGAVFPVYFLFAALVGFNRVYAMRTSNPLSLAGLGLINEAAQRRILVANLTSRPLLAEIETTARRASVLQLNENNLASTLQTPEMLERQGGSVLPIQHGVLRLELWPCAVARMDLEL